VLGFQPLVALVHAVPELFQGGDALVDVGADEALRAALPHRQLHPVGVEEREVHGVVQGGSSDDLLQRHGLAAAGLAAEEQVALGKRDRRLGTVFGDADGDRLPQRHRWGIQQGPHQRRAVGEGFSLTMVTSAYAALPRSFTTRTSRAPRVAARVSQPSPTSPVWMPAGIFTRSCSPTGICLSSTGFGTCS